MLHVKNNCTVLVPEGYPPTVCALGYMVWSLNILAGSGNQLASLDDPRHAWLREEQPGTGKQLPLY